MSELRLNKALASAGVCSRRKADELILAGTVALNGVTVTEPGTRMDPERDVLTLDGKPVRPPLPEGRNFAYVLLYKPVRVVTTADDPEGRETVLDLLPENLRALRLFPVGRLDYFSEGLLLITNDGDFAQRIAHPSHEITKTYVAEVDGVIENVTLRRLSRGIKLDDGPVRPEQIKLIERAVDTGV